MSANIRMATGRRRGFTLIEVLVVLVLVGFITTILMQMLSYSYRIKDRVSVELAKSEQGAMLADWFRQVVAGIQPDFSEGPDAFKGNARTFSALTTNPLSQNYGATTKVSIQLKYDAQDNRSALHYVVNELDTELFGWPGEGGRLIYLDAKNEQHESWPPPMGQWPQRPEAILLEARRDGEPWLIFAKIWGPEQQQPRPVVAF